MAHMQDKCTKIGQEKFNLENLLRCDCVVKFMTMLIITILIMIMRGTLRRPFSDLRESGVIVSKVTSGGFST